MSVVIHQAVPYESKVSGESIRVRVSICVYWLITRTMQAIHDVIQVEAVKLIRGAFLRSQLNGRGGRGGVGQRPAQLPSGPRFADLRAPPFHQSRFSPYVCS